VASAACLDATCRRATDGRGVANTQSGAEQERRFGALRLLTLVTLRLPDVAVYGELLHSEGEEGCAVCLVAQALIGAVSDAMRLGHRALEIHALEVGYGVEVWLERVLESACDEPRECEPAEASLPVMLDHARLATLALTRATALTANDLMLVPGQIADALAHLLAIYLIAVEVVSAA
jgi:hypothetical protein